MSKTHTCIRGVNVVIDCTPDDWKYTRTRVGDCATAVLQAFEGASVSVTFSMEKILVEVVSMDSLNDPEWFSRCREAAMKAARVSETVRDHNSYA